MHTPNSSFSVCHDCYHNHHHNQATKKLPSFLGHKIIISTLFPPSHLLALIALVLGFPVLFYFFFIIIISLVVVVIAVFLYITNHYEPFLCRLHFDFRFTFRSSFLPFAAFLPTHLPIRHLFMIGFDGFSPLRSFGTKVSPFESPVCT
jgi:hypothetical protein